MFFFVKQSKNLKKLTQTQIQNPKAPSEWSGIYVSENGMDVYSSLDIADIVTVL